MYVPSPFKEEDQQKLQQYINDYSFGLFIVADEQGIEATHVPFLLCSDNSSSAGILQCHVARVNPVWKRLQNGAKVLAIFQGPDAYVSPSWYPSKAETGRVVPTWNYLAVHAEGQARLVHDADWLNAHLRQLTNRHESGRQQPWSVDDAPADYTERLVKAIVGIEITIEKLTGKLKASQNHTDANRAGVKQGMATEADAMAKLIR